MCNKCMGALFPVLMLLGGPSMVTVGDDHSKTRETPAEREARGRQLQDRMMSLGQQYADSTIEANRKLILHNLTDVVNQLFDLMITHQENQVADMDARLRDMKKILQEKKSNRQGIVAARVEQIVCEFGGLGWGFNPKPKAPATAKTTK